MPEGLGGADCAGCARGVRVSSESCYKFLNSINSLLLDDFLYM